jgi:nicotinamide-nucleotide amidase
MNNLYDEQALKEIRHLLLSQRASIAVAESVTAGHIQAAISAAMDASDFFEGGITTYNSHQKTALLKVNPADAMASDAVSPTVAGQMAMGVSQLFKSSVGVAITGYASPVPEDGIKELYAYACVVKRGVVLGNKKLQGPGIDPVMVQIHYANAVLKWLAELLQADSEKIKIAAGRT